MATTPHSPDRETLTETTVVLRSRRRDRAQMMNNAVPGFVLLLNGFNALTDPSAGPFWLAALSILAGGALAAIIIREFKSPSPHGGIGWVDVVAGGVLFIEAINKYYQGKHKLSYAQLLLATATVLLGIFHDTISRRRFLRMNATEITARLSPWRKVRLRWEDLRALAIAGTTVTFDDRQEKRPRLDLRKVDNREEAFAALRTFASAMHVGVQEIKA